jgi:hypothetical protein
MEPASKVVLYSGASGAVFFGMNANEFAALCGIAIGLIGLVWNMWLGWRRDKRESQAAEARHQ